jgi:hypothetical protein
MNLIFPIIRKHSTKMGKAYSGEKVVLSEIQKTIATRFRVDDFNNKA